MSLIVRNQQQLEHANDEWQLANKLTDDCQWGTITNKETHAIREMRAVVFLFPSMIATIIKQYFPLWIDKKYQPINQPLQYQ